MKNCFTEAIKQKLDKLYLLIYFDRFAFPHFIYEYNSNFYHYTTDKDNFNPFNFDGEIKKLDIIKYKKCAKFLMIKILQRSHNNK